MQRFLNYVTMREDEKCRHELLLERDEELRKIHTRIIRESGINPKFLKRELIVAQIEKYSAPRFYIEAKQAMLYVTAYYLGKTTHKSKYKQAMVQNLVEVFEEVREQNLHMPMGDVWNLVVWHPAKSFFLSPARITEIIYQYHDRK